jgi:hypothetical protein
MSYACVSSLSLQDYNWKKFADDVRGVTVGWRTWFSLCPMYSDLQACVFWLVLFKDRAGQ